MEFKLTGGSGAPKKEKKEKVAKKKGPGFFDKLTMKPKNDVNFIVSQKLGQKQNQSTSVEFFMVVACIVLFVVFGYMYFNIYTENLDLRNKIIAIYGDDAYIVNSDGKKIEPNPNAADFDPSENASLSTNKLAYYKKNADVEMYTALKAQLESLLAEIETLKRANEEANSNVELTKEHLRIIYTAADTAQVTVNGLTVSGETVTVNCTAAEFAYIQNYIDIFRASGVTNLGLSGKSWFEYIDMPFNVPEGAEGITVDITLRMKSVNVNDFAKQQVENTHAEAVKIGEAIKELSDSKNANAVKTPAAIMQALRDLGYEIITVGDEFGTIAGSYSSYKLHFTASGTLTESVVTVESSDTGAKGDDAIKVVVNGRINAEQRVALVRAEAENVKAVIDDAVSKKIYTEAGIKQYLRSNFFTVEGSKITGLYSDYDVVYTAPTAEVGGGVKIESRDEGAKGDAALVAVVSDKIDSATARTMATLESEEIRNALLDIADLGITGEAEIIEKLALQYFYKLNAKVISGSFGEYTLTYAAATNTQKCEITVSSNVEGVEEIKAVIRNKLSPKEIKEILFDELSDIRAFVLDTIASGVTSPDDIRAALRGYVEADPRFGFSTEEGLENVIVGKFGCLYDVALTVDESGNYLLTSTVYKDSSYYKAHSAYFPSAKNELTADYIAMIPVINDLKELGDKVADLMRSGVTDSKKIAMALADQYEGAVAENNVVTIGGVKYSVGIVSVNNEGHNITFTLEAFEIQSEGGYNRLTQTVTVE